MSGFSKVTINGKVVKGGGSDGFAWCLVEYTNDGDKFPTKIMTLANDDMARKLAGYSEGKPITLEGCLQKRKDKKTGEYGFVVMVSSIAGGKKAAASDDIGF